MGADKILFETELIDGTIDVEVPQKIVILPEWKLTIHFGLASGNVVYNYSTI
jgi:hypothetical protein